MLPYVALDTVDVLGVRLRVFGLLLSLSVIAVFVIAVYGARAFGFTREYIARLTLFTALAAFAGAHLFNFLYHPDSLRAVIANPGVLVTRYTGISSFGGFLGAVAAALLVFRRGRTSLRDSLRTADCFAFGLPLACMIGRIGCALVHDHPGLRSDSFFAVAYPGGPRYDLGLLEVFFLAGLTALFFILKRRQWPAGFYAGAFFSIYGLFRLWLDTLRIDPQRYFGWTVDTYAAAIALLIGLGTFAAIARMEFKHLEGDALCSHALFHS